MPIKSLNTIKERFEGVAANVLEDMITDVERDKRVKVKSLDAELVPDQGVPGTPAVVEVTVTVERSKA